MSPTTAREVRVGLIVLVGLAGLVGLLILAAGGTGYLTRRRTIDVVFRDGQGIRPGCPVRVAGIDAGRVTAVDLTRLDGSLRARVRIAVPNDLAAQLRQDVQITIQSGLTGQSLVNIVSTGRSNAPLARGKAVRGVESSFFDPVLEQVGLGPAERGHLSHMIAEVRETVDAAGPRLRQVLAALQESTEGLRATVASVRPRVEATAEAAEAVARRVDPERIEATIRQLHDLIAQADALIAENRPRVGKTLTSVQGLADTAQQIAAENRPRVSKLITNLDGTRLRADRTLANLESLSGQGADMLARNRAQVDRVVTNVRDASDYGVKLVQKLYGNPFYLSPFYKPTKEDIHAQQMYDAANSFLLAAKEYNDALKTLKAMQGRATTAREKEAYNQFYTRAAELLNVVGQNQRRLAEGLRSTTRR